MSDRAALGQRGVLFYGLLVACMGIWSYVVYQLASGLIPTDEVVRPLQTPDSLWAAPVDTSFTSTQADYVDDFRDPFQWPVSLEPPSRAPAPKPVKNPEPPARPSLELTGVIGRTALFRQEDGSTFMVRVGEERHGIRLVSATPERVVVRFKGHVFKFGLRS